MRLPITSSLRPRTQLRRLAVASAVGATATLASIGIAVPDQVGAAGPTLSAGEIGDLADDALHTLDRAREDRNLARLAQYDSERNAIATFAADALGLDRGEMRRAWAEADLPHQQALLAAISQLGVPYGSMASIEDTAFDCSGLTSYAWARAGVGLSRSSGSQIAEAASRSRDEAMAGDLVQYPGHVMMYLGVDNAIVHSPYTGRTVEITFVRSDRYVNFGNPIG